MVYFTVFLQGGTIKALVDHLKIEKEEPKVKKISDDVHLKNIDLVMSGLGSVMGKMSYSAALENIHSFDKKFIKKWLLRHNVVEDSMTKKLNKINMEEHYARLYGPSMLAHQKKLGGVFKSMMPQGDAMTSGNLQSPISLLQPTLDMMSDDKEPFEKEPAKTEKPALLGNVVMDKILLKNAFSQSSYERGKQSEYQHMHVPGSLRSSDSDTNLEESMLKQRNLQTTLMLLSNAKTVHNLRQPNQSAQMNGGSVNEEEAAKIKWKTAYRQAKTDFEDNN